MSRSDRPLDERRADEIREERDLSAEFEAHLAHRIDDLVQEGLDPATAREQALEEFGDPARLMAESRAARERVRRDSTRASLLDALRQDATFALRQLRRSLGFTAAALATLALGVGVTATIVGVVDAVVLAPLPFEEPDRLVFVEMLTPEGASFSVSEPAFLDWQERSSAFSGLAAIAARGATLRSPGEPRTIVETYLSHESLEVLGVEPRLGRTFTADEDRPGEDRAPVAMLSHEAWLNDFGGDPSVLGTTVDLDGRLHEIVGVLPDGLDLLAGSSPVFVPLGADPEMDRGEHYLSVFGRLADGVTLETARADLARIQAELGELYAVDQGWSATAHPADEVLLGESTIRAGWILLSAAGLLLLMACVNVSNLLVVRATARNAEMGLRAALGAGRGRLARQLFTESALLASAGGVLGLLFAVGALPWVKRLGDGRIPRLDTASLDLSVFGACMAAVAVSTVLVGLAPVARLRTPAARLLSTAGRGGGDAAGRLRALLVGAQVASTVVLLGGTGLLLRSFVELSRVDPGFEAEGTLAVRLDMPDAAYSWAERGDLLPRIRESVASAPGVSAVGATAIDPFAGNSLANFVARVDRMPDRAADFTPVHWRVVTPGFFEAMGMEVRAGRTFDERDQFEAPLPVVIGERLERALFGAESALDAVLVWNDPQGSRLRVVGVVEDLRDVALDQEPQPIIYRPHRQIPWATMTLIARIDGDPGVVTAAVRARIREVAPSLPVPEIHSLETNLRDAIAQPRFNLQLLSGFAVLGLLLAVVGIYGLTAFDVRRRFREIGIRLSLGAEPREIHRLFLRRRVGLTVLGLLVGLAAAMWLMRFVEAQLFGVTARDPWTWVGVVAVVVGTSLVATWVPARRAMRVDPSAVLGSD